jgi:hypothetical protein
MRPSYSSEIQIQFQARLCGVYGSQSRTGTGFMVAKVELGQDLWYPKWNWDRIYGSQIRNGTGFMVAKVELGQGFL